MSSSRLARFSAGRVILLAIFCTILIGAILLALPISRHTPMSFLDLIFTSTSVTCVTGIFTVSLDQFTFFGHCVILALIQVGGLGIITLTLFLLSLFMNLGLATSLMAGKLMEFESWKNLRKLLLLIMITTICAEFLGALSFFTVFVREFSISKAIFLSIFHAVSFFCSCGITLFSNSLQAYAHNYTVIITATLLMLAGGIGFVTLYEITDRISHWREKKQHHFSLQSKMILYGSLIGILLASFLIFVLERNNTLSQFSAFGKVITCIFQAISFKSTGILTVPIAELQLATLFLIMLISFVGSAPGSTGSGIRITTFCVYLAVVKAALEGHAGISIAHRRISKDQVNKAIAIISLGIFWILIACFLLLVFDPQWSFLDLTFEIICAFTNLGLSSGITPFLSILGKILMILSMIIGRIGSLTLILALRKIAIRKEASAEIIYPEERIMLS
jgi:trk/ktr system potassium uptake protein